MRRLRPTLLALLAWAVAGVVVGLVGHLVGGTPWATLVDDYGYDLAAAIIGLSFAVLAAAILHHRPGHAIGRVLLFAAILQPLQLLLGGVAAMVPAPVAGTVAALSSLEKIAMVVRITVWIPALLCPLALLPALLPDGRLPSPRWRWHIALSLTWAAVTAGLVAWASWPWGPAAGIPAAGLGLTDTAFAVRPVLANAADRLYLLAPVLVASGAVAFALRYRRGDAAVRMQLRGVGLAMGVLIVAIPLLDGALTDWAVWRTVGSGLAVSMVPALLALAIVRYDWFDIDLAISRALTAGLLVGFVGFVYVVVVAGVGRVVADGMSVTLRLVATAVVAVGFQPVRRRFEVLSRRLVYGRRATPYEVLAGYADHDTTPQEAGGPLGQAARLLADATGAAVATVWTSPLGAGQPRAAATWPRGEVPSPVASDDALVLVRAVRHGGEVLGWISCTKVRGEARSDGDAVLVDDVAAALGVVLRNTRLTTELQARVAELDASRVRLVGAGDEARRELERALESGAQARLAVLRGDLDHARASARTAGADRVADLMDRLVLDTDHAAGVVREFARGVFPALLDSQGLVTALTAQADHAEIAASVTGDPGPLSRDVEAAIYFVCLEALQNIAKYADAHQIRIRFARHDATVEFEVRDDGTGFDVATTSTGAGLINMQDRLAALGGWLEVTSRPGEGTRVAGRLPLRTPAGSPAS